jgi:phosphogluconate dehydratase
MCPARRRSRLGDALQQNHPQAARTRARHHAASALRSIGHVTVDERAIVNAMVALLATGGSTNHLP